MAEADDKPLPNLDPPSAMEPLLKRIAEGVERLEKKQPPTPPTGMAGAEPLPPMPSSQRQADQPPPNLTPQQFANAGNINIEGRGGQQPGVFGRAAIALQSATNWMADYGLKSSPALHSMTSYSKVASLMAGDVHTRGEQLAGKGLRPSTGGDSDQILRSIEIARGNRGQSTGEPDTSSQIGRNDLKDSIDNLKEAIDSLKDTVKELNQSKSGGGVSAPKSAPKPTVVQAGGRTGRASSISGLANLVANVAANTI